MAQERSVPNAKKKCLPQTFLVGAGGPGAGGEQGASPDGVGPKAAGVWASREGTAAGAVPAAEGGAAALGSRRSSREVGAPCPHALRAPRPAQRSPRVGRGGPRAAAPVAGRAGRRALTSVLQPVAELAALADPHLPLLLQLGLLARRGAQRGRAGGGGRGRVAPGRRRDGGPLGAAALDARGRLHGAGLRIPAAAATSAAGTRVRSARRRGSGGRRSGRTGRVDSEGGLAGAAEWRCTGGGGDERRAARLRGRWRRLGPRCRRRAPPLGAGAGGRDPPRGPGAGAGAPRRTRGRNPAWGPTAGPGRAWLGRSGDPPHLRRAMVPRGDPSHWIPLRSAKPAAARGLQTAPLIWHLSLLELHRLQRLYRVFAWAAILTTHPGKKGSSVPKPVALRPSRSLTLLPVSPCSAHLAKDGVSLGQRAL